MFTQAAVAYAIACIRVSDPVDTAFTLKCLEQIAEDGLEVLSLDEVREYMYAFGIDAWFDGVQLQLENAH